MKKLLIAEASDVFSAALSNALSGQYTILHCDNGHDAIHLLNSEKPDALIINLALPCLDGLHVLQNAIFRPPVILTLTSLVSDYALQSAKDAGAGYAIVLPCTTQCVVHHLQEMVRLSETKRSSLNPQSLTERHLYRLRLSPHRSGFAQLRAGIPIFAQDEGQLMKKELYPAIAALYGNSNPEQVEHTIREAIKEAWKTRDEAVWDTYFPGAEKAPTNKAFIAVLAQKIRHEMKL